MNNIIIGLLFLLVFILIAIIIIAQFLEHKSYRRSMEIAGCKSTRWGCCEDGITTREDPWGSNCPSERHVIYHYLPPSMKLKTPAAQLKTPSIPLTTPSMPLHPTSMELQTPSTSLYTPSTRLQRPAQKLRTPSMKLRDPASSRPMAMN